MSHMQLYSELMAVIQDEVSIYTFSKRYGSQYRLIKGLITHLESAQQVRISNNQKNLVENSNHNNI